MKASSYKCPYTVEDAKTEEGFLRIVSEYESRYARLGYGYTSTPRFNLLRLESNFTLISGVLFILMDCATAHWGLIAVNQDRNPRITTIEQLSVITNLSVQVLEETLPVLIKNRFVQVLSTGEYQVTDVTRMTLSIRNHPDAKKEHELILGAQRQQTLRDRRKAEKAAEQFAEKIAFIQEQMDATDPDDGEDYSL